MKYRHLSDLAVLENPPSPIAGQKCYFCGGNGICHVCGGTGFDSVGNVCGNCGGSRRCKHCGGTGVYMVAEAFVEAIGSKPTRN